MITTIFVWVQLIMHLIVVVGYCTSKQWTRSEVISLCLNTILAVLAILILTGAVK